MTTKPYEFAAIEAKWQAYWKDQGLFKMDPKDPRPKYYCLMMFPYPSGTLHVGHGRNYTIGDVIARYKSMRGFNVLAPMGWDALGLPAENAAIKHNTHPRTWTLENIAKMKEQLYKWGVFYDWDREIASCHPKYYKWTQWLFTKFYENGLAYRKKAKVNWCPDCATVLANEQVKEGTCERCDAAVIQKDLTQWFFRITQYAQRLLDDLDTLTDWPDRVLNMQRAWIGRSEGAFADFKLQDSDETIRVFTTRPDTLYGATFMCLAPEHPLVDSLIADAPNRADIEAYRSRVVNTKEIERIAEGGAKEGVFTGAYAINPVNGEAIPIWLANYVLAHYGTGAIMAVPAHDQRDFEFARQYDIPVRVVIQSDDRPTDGAELQEAWSGEGSMINSDSYNGMSSEDGQRKIIDDLNAKNMGEGAVNFKLRDWLLSRQRYWGCPIPIVYCDDCGEVPVPQEQLPVVLPEVAEFKSTGDSPLKSNDDFYHTTCPKCNGKAVRETDTMDTFVDSSWYFLRYLSPRDDENIFDTELVNEWLPVDQYIGGIEHAILHLLYARFFTKAMQDFGLVNFSEPFKRLFTQGMICKDGFKMSKSKGNVVSPADLIKKYGTDTQRLYLLFIGPPEKDAEWNDRDIVGCHRFLSRVWDTVTEHATPVKNVTLPKRVENAAGSDGEGLYRKVNQVIEKITRDIERDFHFNTAIAAMMELVNEMKVIPDLLAAGGSGPAIVKYTLCNLVRMLSCFTPHIGEELWRELGYETSVLTSGWPECDQAATVTNTMEIPVQINGKVRDRITIARGSDQQSIVEQIKASAKLQPFLEGKTIVKEIYIPDKLLNLVVK